MLTAAAFMYLDYMNCIATGILETKMDKAALINGGEMEALVAFGKRKKK